ncbi:class A beta-lactamase-related serine hydrolase [Streptomyces ficellus]|uniref:Class A beta-lactamase-related serine hydrolase n=2 Tax=Streptomyces ficellus TaxID=1977088 RepID=A0A6I6FDE8_9ACTN|nr:serine hydrolase domain-containing protein [Streptomyces ficellus]QGV82023.1 class A beta-lactamase-related serine hydrolase [Streptomyces ficellus]
MRLVALTSSAVLLSVAADTLPAHAATGAHPAGTRTAAVAAFDARHGLDRAELRDALTAIHQAGMYGTFSSVRNGSARWTGAAGFADRDTHRPVRPQVRQRAGSITKTFTAVAVLQQVARGRIELDAPVGRYLPDLIPGERGRTITVRMLLNHTSGLGDHVLGAFPGLLEDPGKALDARRFHRFAPEELVRIGLETPAPKPLGTHSYSNTNYVIAGLLLREVTGLEPEEYITRHVIRKAGLRHTYFPKSPYLTGPHTKMYESMYGMIEPARDYSAYDMSWCGVAGSLVSTADDLNSFYRQLLTGKLLPPAELRAMKTTVPGHDTPPGEEAVMKYGLGLYTLRLPDGRWYWGHDGGVFGAGTWVLSTEDGRRQVAVGYNLMKYQRFDDQGQMKPHPIDAAMLRYVTTALGGTAKRSQQTMPRPFAAPETLR